MANLINKEFYHLYSQAQTDNGVNYGNKKFQTVDVLGLPFANLTATEVIERVFHFVHNDTLNNMFIVTANPEIAYFSHTNNDYQKRIKDADFIVPDGIGIVKAAKFLNTPLIERVPGIELMEEMLHIANSGHKRVFLLGSSKEGVKRTREVLESRFPNIVFDHKHGYKPVLDYKVIEKVKKFDPDFVFVAMGFPKQEDWIYYNKHHFTHTLFMGVGGSFDVISGNVKRAPKLFRKMNLEWFYRIVTDFKRFDRAMKIPLFLKEVYKQKLNISKKFNNK